MPDVRESQYLAFGQGISCFLGASLASVEAEIAFPSFFKRFSNRQPGDRSRRMAPQSGVPWPTRAPNQACLNEEHAYSVLTLLPDHAGVSSFFHPTCHTGGASDTKSPKEVEYVRNEATSFPGRTWRGTPLDSREQESQR